jgi:hypothetical protein
MENKDISQIALQKIKESGIKPISKNIFNIKKVLFWSLVGFSVVVGVVSFAVILSLLFNNDWYLYNTLGLGFIFKTLPYFWFVFLALFTILGDYYYRKTFMGYRHRTITIVGVYIVITILSGSILHVVGTGKLIEESLREHVPMYRGFMFDKDEFWSHPEEGLLSGKIVEINGQVVRIIDLNGNNWLIDIKNSSVGGRVKIEVGERIKIIGDKDIDDIFTANEIRPWMGNGLKKNEIKGKIMR